MASSEENSEYNPKRFGLMYNPPRIVIEYLKESTGKLYHHKIKLKTINENSKISELVDDLYKNHGKYLNHKKVSKAQIIQLVEKLRVKTVRNAEEDKEIEEQEYNIKNEDLNGLTREEIKEKKKEMDIFFDKNNIKSTDKDFQYDIRKEFPNDGSPEWDDDEDF